MAPPGSGPRDTALVRLYGATFLYTLSHAIGVPLIPAFLQVDFGATVGFIGVAMGLYGVMQIFLRLPMGDMADRRGRKPSLLIAFACTMASALIFAFALNKWWVFPGIAFFGFAGGIYWVAANSYLFDRAGEGSIARATSDYSLSVGLAFLVGPLLGYVIADQLGFRAAFFTYFATSLLGLLLVATLPEVKPAPRPRPATSAYRRALTLLKHPALVVSAFGTFLYSTLFSTTNAFFQLHVLALGFGLVVAGALLTGRQAAATVVRVGLPRVLQRAGPERVLLVGVVVTALATAAVPFATSMPALVAVVAVGGAATGVMIPANLMLVHRGAPKAERGLANGIYGTMLGAGSAIAPAVFGFVGSRLGLAWSFWAAAGVALVLVSFVFVWMARSGSLRAPVVPAP